VQYSVGSFDQNTLLKKHKTASYAVIIIAIITLSHQFLTSYSFIPPKIFQFGNEGLSDDKTYYIEGCD